MSIHIDDLRDIAANRGYGVCDLAADEIEDMEKAYELLFSENARLRAQIEALSATPAQPEAEPAMNEWQDNGFQEAIFFNSEGKVLGSITGSYSHSRWSAAIYGKGYIGEYMTNGQAKAAVERNIEDGRAAHRDGYDAFAAWNRRVAPAPTAQAPDGWQLVPKEPTPEMCGAVLKAFNIHRDLAGKSFGGLTDAEVYRAMLAAAPPPPTSSGQTSPGVELSDAEIQTIGKNLLALIRHSTGI